MRIRCRTLFAPVVLSLFLAANCNGQAKSPASPDRTQAFAKIDEAAVAGIKKHNFPGISVGIVLNGKNIYAKGFGYANRDSKKLADENTVYQIGSVTKTFTGNILAQLISEKKISFDEPVAKFFPKTLNFPRDKNGKAITVRDIATHSA